MSNARFSIIPSLAVNDLRITNSQFRTLAALGMYANKEGWCFPSLATLGRDLNKSLQAVGRDTIALRDLGYLQVNGRFDTVTGARHTNLYRLRFDFDDTPLQREVEPPSTSEVEPPSTSEVEPPSTSEVEVNAPVNAPINAPVNISGRTHKKTAPPKAASHPEIKIDLIGERMSSYRYHFDCRSGDMITQWLADFPEHIVLRAIEEAHSRGADNIDYVDRIIISWKAKGVPPTREERIAQEKNKSVSLGYQAPKKPRARMIN